MRRSENAAINFALWRLWDVWHYLAGVAGIARTEYRLRKNLPQKRHSIPGEVIVSLTSHPVRFPFLEKTLKSLLTQTVKADRVTLWIAHEDMDKLTKNILDLKEHGLEIYGTENYRSFTKLVPALKMFPDAYIVTADDDVYYSPEWLEVLLEEWDGQKDHILGYKGFYFLVDENGMPTPTTEWREDPTKLPDGEKHFMPLGESGILYPPHSLYSDVTDEKLFTTLSPKADDFWFYWMARMGKATYKKAHYNWTKINWPGSQKYGLWKDPNLHTENHKRLSNLHRVYGWPS